MKDLAIKKLEQELKELKKGSSYVMAVKQPVYDALVEFCRQDGEFAQAVYQGGSFEDCLKAVVNGVRSSLSDLEAYRRAVLRDCPEYGLMPGYVILSLQVPAWDHIWPSVCLDGGDAE